MYVWYPLTRPPLHVRASKDLEINFSGFTNKKRKYFLSVYFMAGIVLSSLLTVFHEILRETA